MSARAGRGLLISSCPGRSARPNDPTEMTKQTQTEKRNAFNARPKNGRDGPFARMSNGPNDKTNPNGKDVRFQTPVPAAAPASQPAAAATRSASAPAGASPR